MKRILAVTLLLVLTSTTGHSQNTEEKETKFALKLQSMNFQANEHKMRMMVLEGEYKDGKFIQGGEPIPYEIDFDSAVMTVDGVSRKFADYEGTLLGRQMDFFINYCMDSIKWWKESEATQKAKTKNNASQI